MTDPNRTPSYDPRSPPNGPQRPSAPPNPPLSPSATFGAPSTPPDRTPPMGRPSGYGPPSPPGHGLPVPLGPPIPPSKRGLSTGAIVALVIGVSGTVFGRNRRQPRLTCKQRGEAHRAGCRSDDGRRWPAVRERGECVADRGSTAGSRMRTVTETGKIPFTKKTVNDASLAAGTREIRTRGVTGLKSMTYQVTFTDGVETDKQLLHHKITTAPIAQITAIGTKAERQCDPNYGGGCVPIASDVDCAGGSGNGPAYVKGGKGDRLRHLRFGPRRRRLRLRLNHFGAARSARPVVASSARQLRAQTPRRPEQDAEGDEVRPRRRRVLAETSDGRPGPCPVRAFVMSARVG